MKILAAFILIMASVHPEAHGATVENASRVTGSRVIDGSSECIINLADTTKHGAVQVGNSGKVVFRISNTGSGRGIITDITCSNHCFTTNLYGVSIDSGQQKKLEVYFIPVGIGIEKGVLSMRTNDPSKPLLTVMLYGKGMDYTLYFQEDLTLKETPYSSGGTWSVSHYLYTAMPPVGFFQLSCGIVLLILRRDTMASYPICRMRRGSRCGSFRSSGTRAQPI